MKKILTSFIFIISVNLGFAEEILPVQVEINTAPKPLSLLIDKFIMAINDPRRGEQILTIDLKSSFREIAIPESFRSPKEENQSLPEFETKLLYRVDEDCYIQIYDTKDSKLGIKSRSAIWVKGVNSWHIDAYGDPLELAIHKFNIKRAMK